MNFRNRLLVALLPSALCLTSLAETEAETGDYRTVRFSHSELTGIGFEEGVMRRDPSDVIKVGDLFYVWYTKGDISPGYDATIYYATSKDGREWSEKGEALAKGEAGSWESASVFTPNILVAEGRYWLFYTGTSIPYDKEPFNPDSKIGIAVADSPDGPWERMPNNPVLANSEESEEFDSHLVDDACAIVREGRYWLYYKGRQMGKGPGHTKMGLAIAEKPEGPYVRHESNPVVHGNHEVVVWPQGSGVAALIGRVAPAHIKQSVLYAEDGVTFRKTHNTDKHPWAAGSYRPEAFTDSNEGKPVEWGVEIGHSGVRGTLPFIRRFDVSWDEE
ncbi:MAG: family 43 glycosylhydrolase [Verrucomicrobiota bacterium JB023]|nr:family 43 glycosylhydrolase [Verrucomicrobiota bacterium JB023]